MVHVIDGEVKPGHFPRTSDAYQRRPTAFKADIPAEPLAENKGKKLHLVVSSACPWAHRALVVRQLRGLQDQVSVSVVSPFRDDDMGWNFGNESDAERYGTGDLTSPSKDNASGDGFKHLVQLYIKADPKYTGNVTTPCLYDRDNNKMISNDSWNIVRYLSRALPGTGDDLYPKGEEESIDKLAQWVQDKLNNGVYQCGLSLTQEAYDSALGSVFSCLNELETILSNSRFLAGRDKMTVADVQLFTTLVRFDSVYFPLFKCYERRLVSYRNLSNYMRDVFQTKGVAETVSLKQIRDHYYTTFTSANTSGVIALGEPDCSRPHDRARFAVAEVKQSVNEENQKDKAERQKAGEFVRGVSAWRRWITRDGTSEFPAEKGRYIVYASNNCPWCHRVLLARAMLGLEEVIDVDVMFYRRHDERGWQFLPADSELRPFEIANKATLLDGKVALKDSVNGKRFVREIYEMCESAEKSVPLLFDKKTNQVVNNESSEIIRMFNSAFKDFHTQPIDLYPEHLAKEIDEINSWTYPDINNGAYKAGFSSKQDVYEAAYKAYFAAWDRLELILADRRFLTGDNVTEADLRLFPTLARHDPVYYSRMKLNGRMVLDMPNLDRWLKEMYDLPGVAAGTNIDHCIAGYFGRTGNQLIPPSLKKTKWY